MRSLAFCGREDIKSHFDMRGQFKKVVLLLLALQFGSMDFGSAQSLVRLGDCEFEPEPNVVVSAARSVRSVPQDKVFRIGEVTGGRRNVLFQFKRGVGGWEEVVRAVRRDSDGLSRRRCVLGVVAGGDRCA